MRLIRRTRAHPGIDLHLLDLDADPAPLEGLERDAPAHTLARAARLRTSLQRRRLLVREAAVRRLVGERLSRPAEEVRVVREPRGRPGVEGCGLALSLSQSRGLALVALAGSGAVGCDLQHRDDAVDWRDARDADVLSGEEVDRLAALPTAQDARALFVQMWALKEAALKCLGVGLSVPASVVTTHWDAEVAIGDALEAAVLDLHRDCAAAVVWRFSN